MWCYLGWRQGPWQKNVFIIQFFVPSSGMLGSSSFRASTVTSIEVIICLTASPWTDWCTISFRLFLTHWQFRMILWRAGCSHKQNILLKSNAIRFSLTDRPLLLDVKTTVLPEDWVISDWEGWTDRTFKANRKLHQDQLKGFLPISALSLLSM